MQRELHYSSLATGSSRGAADSAREYAPVKHPCRGMFERVVAYVLLMCLAVISFSTPVNAAVCRVTTAGNAAGSGAWASPMDLQTALMNTACSEVWVAAGTYTPTTGTTRTISFNIRPSVAVYGGFAGSESQRTERNPASHVTTLSGDIGTPNNISDNSYHVVLMDGTTSAGVIDNNTVLDGFTIRSGNAGGDDFPDFNGGGLLCRGNGTGKKCSPSLSQLVFDTNRAGWVGGAMYNYASNGGVSSPVLSNVAFIRNTAVEYGGAIYNEGYEGNSSPRLANVSFDGNSSDYSGGAMYNGGGGLGGISSPILSNVTFSNNHADDDGGAMDNDGYDGGASKPVLNNVTFSGNSAGRGGAMFNDANSGTSSPVLSNVILWGNTATNSGPEMVNYLGASASISHSVIAGGCASISGAVCGSGNIAGDPKLGALANNGGLTPTMLPGADSPAIDAGNAATCANAYVNKLDQRGVSRPQGSGCDIGAVEVQGDVIFVDGFDPVAL